MNIVFHRDSKLALYENVSLEQVKELVREYSQRKDFKDNESFVDQLPEAAIWMYDLEFDLIFSNCRTVVPVGEWYENSKYISNSQNFLDSFKGEINGHRFTSWCDIFPDRYSSTI